MHLFVHLPDSLFGKRDAEFDATDVQDRVFGQEYLAIKKKKKSQTIAAATINDYDEENNNTKKKQS